MSIHKKQTLRKILYTSLSLSLILLSVEAKAMRGGIEDYSDGSNQRSYSVHPKVEKDNKEDIQYTIVGVSLFSGKDLVSKAIKGVTQSKYSHVGIILADASDEGNKHKWKCFESTGSVGEALKLKYPHVRLTNWDDLQQHYPGKISYRVLVFEDKGRPNAKAITRFVKENDNKPYTKNPLKLIRALFKNNNDSLDKCSNTYFCSELTAKTFMKADLLPKGVPSNYLPRDFSSKKDLPLLSGVTLTSEFIEKQ